MAQSTEQDRLRVTRFTCMSCAGAVMVGPNYPPGVPIPGTLELFCSQCRTINIIYQPSAWAKTPEA